MHVCIYVPKYYASTIPFCSFNYLPKLINYMAGSSGGAGGVPPGFRFHPTDEELLHFYLKKKISFQKFDMEVIREVDLNKIEPWELQEKCKIGSTPQNEWYFFSHKDRKYPTGSRTNRATSAGFWKATGRDKCIRNSFNKIGMRKTLVFYRGRAPHGQKTDWIMHEYRLEDSSQDPQPTHEDGWVICRVFKKKNLFKIAGSSSSGELGGHQHHQHHQHHHHSNNNGNGMMMMMNGGDDHLSTSSTSAASSMNHLQYLNYSHHIPHYAAQVEAAAHNNFISNSSHMNLNTSTTNYDHHQDHLENYNNNEVMGGSPNILQVKQFMSSSTRSADHHDSSQLPMDPHQQQHNQDQWDGQLVITTNPPASTPTQINQLSLRSTEMQDFWAYGK